MFGLLLGFAVSCSAGSAPHSAGVAPRRPTVLAVGARGVLYIADPMREQILERHPNGRFTVLAGTGRAGFSGDGGPAKVARVDLPGGMAVAADGTVYFADRGNGRVRAISPSGRITTVAGDGQRVGTHFVKDGAPALQAAIQPAAVAFGPGRDLYIAAGEQVLRLNRNGTLTAVLGGNDRTHSGVTGVGGPAVDASADDADGLAFDNHGVLYVSGFATKALLIVRRGVLRVPTVDAFYPRYVGGLTQSPAGPVYAANGTSVMHLYAQGPMQLSTSRELGKLGVGAFEVDGIAFAPDGAMYVDTYAGNGDAHESAIAEITPSGQVRLIWQAS